MSIFNNGPVKLPDLKSLKSASTPTAAKETLQIDPDFTKKLVFLSDPSFLTQLEKVNLKLFKDPEKAKNYDPALLLSEFKRTHPQLREEGEPLNGVLTATWKRAVEKEYFTRTYNSDFKDV